MTQAPALSLGLGAVILAVTDEDPRVLVIEREVHEADVPNAAYLAQIQRTTPDALPFGPLDPAGHRTLERALRGWVREQTGLKLGYVEQLYTFGDRGRHPEERWGAPRVVSVAYLALVREARPGGASGARWRSVYEAFPWEDRRSSHELMETRIAPALEAWIAETDERKLRRARRERVDITFGLQGVSWDEYRVLERYELLYEAGLVEEAPRDARLRDAASGRWELLKAPLQPPITPRLGRPMAFDHRRLLATALGRLRGKLKFRPVVFELLPPTFTLLQLQRVVEALAGGRLHKQNFRRLVDKGGLVEGTDRYDTQTGGRPAELFRFRREVLRERPRPGLGLPGFRTSG